MATVVVAEGVNCPCGLLGCGGVGEVGGGTAVPQYAETQKVRDTADAASRAGRRRGHFMTGRLLDL
jgi:hypothetical protein